MDKEKTSIYKVIITHSAEIRFYEILEYLYEHYSLERAEELAIELNNLPQTLSTHPYRGSIETNLKHSKKEYRYILFNRSKKAKVKVLYYVEESVKEVYITDFFPVEMNNKKMPKRNK